MWCRYGGVVKLTTDKWLTADFGYPGSSESQKYTRNCRFEILLRECHFNKCFGWNSRCNSPSTYFVYLTRIWVIIGVLWGSLKQLTVTLIDREGEGIPGTWSHFLIQGFQALNAHFYTKKEIYKFAKLTRRPKHLRICCIHCFFSFFSFFKRVWWIFPFVLQRSNWCWLLFTGFVQTDYFL